MSKTILKNSLFSLTLNPGVVKLIKTRISLKFNNPLKYSNKVPFVILYSNAKIDGKMDKSKNNQFINGMISNNVSNDSIPFQYELGGKPHPIILNIQIQSFSTYGALRKATISITCFSLLQLNEILQLYMVPGISCVLQWGWTERTNLYVNFDNDFNIDIYKIYNFRLINNYNSDIMLGIISNFNWSLNPDDGSFKCLITLISLGNKFFLVFKLNDSLIKLKLFFIDIIKLLGTYNPNTDKNDFVNYRPYVVSLIQGSQLSLISNRRYIPVGLILTYLNDVFGKNVSFNSAYNKINMNPYIRSLNPTQCIIPKYKDYVLYGPIDCKDYRSYIVSPNLKTVAFSLFTGYVRDLLVLFSVFKNAFSTNNIIQAMQNILDVINSNTLNYLDLRLLIQEDGVWKIVDYSSINIKKELTKLNVYNSIMRSVSLLSTLPLSFKPISIFTRNTENEDSLMASYIRKIWGVNITDRNTMFQGSTVVTSSKGNNLTILLTDIKQPDKFLYDLYDVVPLIDNYKVCLPLLIIPLYKKLLFNNMILNTGRMLNLSISILMDGISGVLFGQVFQIDYIPDRYNKDAQFVVRLINDSISNGSWNTTIVGMLAAKPDISRQKPVDKTKLKKRTSLIILQFNSSLDIRLSLNALSFMKKILNFKSNAYNATGGLRYLTIGYGHNGPDVKPGMTISPEDALLQYKIDVRTSLNYVARRLRKVLKKLKQYQFDALTMLTYNAGPKCLYGLIVNNFLKSKEPNFLELRNLFPSYTKGNNKQGVLVLLPGLIRRRKAELALFSGYSADLCAKIYNKTWEDLLWNEIR